MSSDAWRDKVRWAGLKTGPEMGFDNTSKRQERFLANDYFWCHALFLIQSALPKNCYTRCEPANGGLCDAAPMFDAEPTRVVEISRSVPRHHSCFMSLKKAEGCNRRIRQQRLI